LDRGGVADLVPAADGPDRLLECDQVLVCRAGAGVDRTPVGGGSAAHAGEAGRLKGQQRPPGSRGALGRRGRSPRAAPPAPAVPGGRGPPWSTTSAPTRRARPRPDRQPGGPAPVDSEDGGPAAPTGSFALICFQRQWASPRPSGPPL